jgi:pimeloyl-ACP methyl ester carboxylesterase
MSLSSGPIGCTLYRLACRRSVIQVCRLPGQGRPDKPLALFLPDIFGELDHDTRLLVPFTDLFDLIVCELPAPDGRGTSPHLSLDGLAREYATLIDCYVPCARTLTVIGNSLGGLLGLALAQQRPERVERVVLLDSPLQLTRPELRAALSRSWLNAGTTDQRRILEAIYGFDPISQQLPPAETPVHHLAADLAQECILIAGSEAMDHTPPEPLLASVVTEADLARLRFISPEVRVAPRIRGAGHAVLLENAASCLRTLERRLPRGPVMQASAAVADAAGLVPIT